MAALDDIAAASRARAGDATHTQRTSAGRLVVAADPNVLAESAGVTLDVYACARMISSEKGSGTPQEFLALAEAARNHAAAIGKSVASMLLYAKDSESNGHFGEQAAGRWASTRLDPTAQHIAAAKAALDDATDTARGAVDFFDPGGQVVGATQGSATIKTSAKTYILNNEARGLEWIGPLDGVNANRLMLFAKKTSAEAKAALASVASGDAADATTLVLVLVGIAGLLGMYLYA